MTRLTLDTAVVPAASAAPVRLGGLIAALGARVAALGTPRAVTPEDLLAARARAEAARRAADRLLR